MEKLNCAQAKKIDMVGYLDLLGLKPQKTTGQDYWYLSPLHSEKTASFKINRKLNLWYDHGLGQGGDLIDFGTAYYSCPTNEFLARLSLQQNGHTFPFHQPLPIKEVLTAVEKKKQEAGRIIINDVRPLKDKILLAYIAQRNIPVNLAISNCKEVDFSLYGRKRTVIGFENDQGGYELRGPDFKGSSSPKAITFLNNGSDKLAVFEGFFNYMSFLVINNSEDFKLPNFLVLNSTAFFQQSRQLMEQHQQVNLYMDKNTAGVKFTSMAIKWDRNKFIDWSTVYGKYEDLNDWLTKKNSAGLKQERRFRRGL